MGVRAAISSELMNLLRPFPIMDASNVDCASGRGKGKDMSERRTGLTTSGTAIAGLVIGILAAVSSWIPIINNLSFVLAVIGLVLAVVGLVATMRGKKAGKGLAVAALVINLVAAGMVLATQSAVSAAIDEATSAPEVSSLSSSGGASEDQAGPSDDAAGTQDEAQPATDLEPGASVELANGLSVSVDSVEAGLANYDGSEVVAVRVTYVNNGSEQTSYNTYDWKGEDANGAQEYAAYYSEAEDDLGSGTLAAGGTKSGTIYFEGGTVKALYFGNMLSDEPSASWTIG